MISPTCVSLFSGIEGFGLAAHRVGWCVNATVEINSFCRGIIKAHFPHAQQYGNIFDFNNNYAYEYQDKTDILFGGFPCQPFSHAGKQRGAEDERYLFPEFERAIRIIRPPIILAENVAGLTTSRQYADCSHLESETLGSTSENYLLPQIIESIEGLGYAVKVFDIPASSIEKTVHIRQRLFIVAHNPNTPRQPTWYKGIGIGAADSHQKATIGTTEGHGATNAHFDSAYPQCTGLEGQLYRTTLHNRNEGIHARAENSGTEHNYTDPNGLRPQKQGLRQQTDRTRQFYENDTDPNGCECGGEVEGGSCKKNCLSAVNRQKECTTQRISGVYDLPQSEFKYEFDADWLQAATALCGVGHALSDGLDVARLRNDLKGLYPELTEKEIAKAIDSTARQYRTKRLMALGNAVVPDVPMVFFEAINQYYFEKKI